ncbi:MAG: pentapeptide repeat-containing protein [bacterium]|nr:pentapeptide repeat-containing protein [bacterium]
MKFTGPIRDRKTGAVIHSGEGSLRGAKLANADLKGVDLRNAVLA